MVVIGLTGGIGTGKSEVARTLRGLGASVIGADALGHEAYLPQTKAWQEVVEAFGSGILTSDGQIDRRKLGPLVFGDPAARATLNAILHPKMAVMLEGRIAELGGQGATAVVVEAALLIEAGWTSLVDEVWVTVAPDALTVERLHDRSGLSAEQVEARRLAQLSQEERGAQADVVIENSGSLEELRDVVKRLWEIRILGRKAEYAR